MSILLLIINIYFNSKLKLNNKIGNYLIFFEISKNKFYLGNRLLNVTHFYKIYSDCYKMCYII